MENILSKLILRLNALNLLKDLLLSDQYVKNAVFIVLAQNSVKDSFNKNLN